MARMGGADSSSFSSRTSSSNSSSVFQNYPLISALLAFALAQSTKFFATWFKERRWDPKRLVGSGGMPSSHSATVTAVAIAVGFQDGFGSSLFAAAIVFACVVMYDAFGVRLHAGKQAERVTVEFACISKKKETSQFELRGVESDCLRTSCRASFG